MTPPLVSLEDVDVTLAGRTVLQDLNWRFYHGENWAVLGGNGSGKSTFLKLVRGELWPAPGRGRRIFALDGEAQESAVGVQEIMPLVSPESQERCRRLDWARTVRDVVASGISGGDFHARRLRPGEREQVERAGELLGLTRLWERDVRELSTGELRRTMLARALAGAPRVLVCDEVCDGLDAGSRATLLQALAQISGTGTQLLLTTHRAEELIPAITHRLLLANGRILEQGAFGRDARKKESSTSQVMTESKVAKLPFRPPTTTAQLPLISVQDASVYLARRPVLRGISWQLQAGEHWFVSGPNGSGKSTFLKLISGDLHPALHGHVKRFEFTPENTLWQLRRRIGFVSPELQADYRENLTGAEVIATGHLSTIGFIKRPSHRRVRMAAALAQELGFGELARKSFLEMSYGECRKILVARALVHEPSLLILDEPFDGLDAPARAAMREVLQRAAERGASLVVVTHHPADLPGCITHHARLEAGRIVEQGRWQISVNPLETKP